MTTPTWANDLARGLIGAIAAPFEEAMRRDNQAAARKAQERQERRTARLDMLLSPLRRARRRPSTPAR